MNQDKFHFAKSKGSKGKCLTPNLAKSEVFVYVWIALKRAACAFSLSFFFFSSSGATVDRSFVNRT